MSTLCSQCGNSIPDSSRFCNHCGFPQNDNESLEEMAHRTCEKIIRELNEEALEAKHKLLEDFQDKATKWVKTQFFAATTAISLVLAILAYAGFSGFDASEKFQQVIEESTEDYQQVVDANKQAVIDNEKDIKASMESFNRRVEEVDRMLAQKTQQIEDLNTDNIKRYQASLDKMIRSLTDLADRYERQQTTIQTQLAEIEKLKNSQLQILVHYRDDTMDSYQKNIKRLTGALYQAGYFVDTRNIANVSADRQEILYYSNAPRIISKVEDIRGLLQATLGRPLPIRFVNAGDANPLRFVIKLCGQEAPKNGRCKGVTHKAD